MTIFSIVSRQPYQIVLTQGILYSLGGSILFNGTFSLIPEWFVRRRGLASGICYAGKPRLGGTYHPLMRFWCVAGTSVGGIFLPYLLAALLPRYGWRTTLRCLVNQIHQISIVCSPHPYRRSVAVSFWRPQYTTSEVVCRPAREAESYSIARSRLAKCSLTGSCGCILPRLYCRAWGTL